MTTTTTRMLTCNLSAPTPPRIRVNLSQTRQSRQVASVQAHGRRSSVIVSRLPVAQLNEPKIPLNGVKKKLLEVIPEPVKQVPWKNAEEIFRKNLLDASVKALKFVCVPLFILSFLCDVIFSILKNKELLIPVGLFVGCTLSDFLNETFQDLFRKSKQESGSSRQLLYISGLFVVTRIVCSSLSLMPSVFLMHIANGGLMQVLWLWRNSQETSRSRNFEEGSITSQVTS